MKIAVPMWKKVLAAGILARFACFFFVVQLFSVNSRHGIILDSRWLENTKNCPVPLVPTMVDLQVILNEVLAKYKILRVPTKSIHLENGAASPVTFPPVAHLRVYSKCSWKLLSCYIGLVSSVRRFFFLLSGFSFTNMYESQDYRGRKGKGISLTPHYHFHLLHWVAGWLLQRAHLCT